jgi:multidrug efflux pump subunit AcrA (membrane-fusion protein)
MTLRNSRPTVSLILVAGVAALCACEKQPAGSSGKPGTTGSSVKDTINSAADKAKPAFEEARAKAVTAAQSALDAAQTEYDSLRAKAPSVPAEAKAAYDKTIVELDENWKKTKATLDDLKTAGADAWQKVSTDLSASTSKFLQSVRDAAKQYPPK